MASTKKLGGVRFRKIDGKRVTMTPKILGQGYRGLTWVAR